ncbi:MAG TPA: hypothetical protein VNZ25_01435 [Candidatus Angelobacter sp.]|jgi:hypothetical protein|nr:hypothetical protein [Candidatus Angelobacter sp.]
MPKSKLIRPSELDPSNRKLLAAAQQAGLNPDEIIRKSVEAAYGKLRRPVTKPGGIAVTARNHRKPAAVNPLAK